MSMKKAVREGITGVVAGLVTVVVWQILTNEEARKVLKGRFESVKRKVKTNLGEMDEEAMLLKARQTGDPSVNQKWVENQWKAVE